MCTVCFVEFCEHGLICATRKFTFFIYECHNVELLNCYQVESILIVDKFNVLPVNCLMIVLFLLELKNVLNKELLEILIRIIDAKLGKKKI